MKRSPQHKALMNALKGDKNPRVKGMVYKKVSPAITKSKAVK